MGSTCNTPKKHQKDQLPQIHVLTQEPQKEENKDEPPESEVNALPPKKHSKKKKAQRTQDQEQEVQDNQDHQNQQTQSNHPLQTAISQKINIFSKQTSQTTNSDTINYKRQTLNDDSVVTNSMKKMASKLNPGKESLRSQREFYWDQFILSLEEQIIDKQILTDIYQMIKMFLSHIESSPIYWTRFLHSGSFQVIQPKALSQHTKRTLVKPRKLKFSIPKTQSSSHNYLTTIISFNIQVPSIQSLFQPIKALISSKINKKYLNFYVFSEQEFFDFPLDTIDYDLVYFLMRSLQLMHSNSYFHGGIKISNIFMHFDQNGKKQYKLDISFEAFQLRRRNLKPKELRAQELHDIEDVACLVFNYYFKTDIRQLYQKLDFEEFSRNLQFDEGEYFRQFLVLMNQINQLAYDLRAEDFFKLLNRSKIQQKEENFKQAPTSPCLWCLKDDHVIFYCLTSQFSSKSITKYRVPKALMAASSKQLFLVIKENLYSMEFKMLNAIIEDTLEIIIMAFKQVMAQLDKTRKKETVDSTHSSYSLQLNQTNSPLSVEGEDQFKFNNVKNEASNKKNVQSSFYDKVFFTTNSILVLFNLVDVDSAGYINAEMIAKCLKSKSEFIDDSLLNQLIREENDPSEDLNKLCNFFSQNGKISLLEFKNIFRFRERKHTPQFDVSLTQLYNIGSSPIGIAAETDFVYLLTSKLLIIYNVAEKSVQQQIDLLTESFMKIIPIEKQIILVGVDQSKLVFQFYDKQSYQTSEIIYFNYIPPSQDYFITYLPSIDLFLLIDSENIILIENGIKFASVPKPRDMPIPERCNYSFSNGLFLFICADRLHRVWVSGNMSHASSNLVDIIRLLGRQETKIKVRLSSTNFKQLQNDLLGQYKIINQIYPPSESQIVQFRIFTVYKQQNERSQILIQRIVHGEFESFDDCYSICTFYDQQKLLQDYFITYEFDGRIRINMVFQEGEPIYSKQNDSVSWLLLKRSIKTLNCLRLNGIVVQEMCPEVISYQSKQIMFYTLISKSNLPSIFSDKFVPFVGSPEFFDLITFKALQDKQFQNQILINPLKANIYSLALVFMKILHKKPPPFTNDFQLFVCQALSTLQCSNELKRILSEMLNDNENKRFDCTQLLKLMKEREKEQYNEIYFIQPSQQQFLKLSTKSINDTNQQNLVVLIENNLHIFGSQNLSFRQLLSAEGFTITAISLLRIESEELFRTLKILVSLQNEQIIEYKILVLKLREDQKEEIVNFNDFLDDENDDSAESKRILISLQQYVKSPNIKVDEIEIPFFELFQIKNVNVYNQEQDTYFFGRDESLDCFMYNSKKMVGKKIGQLSEKIDECSVIDTVQQFYLIERKFTLENGKMFIKVVTFQHRSTFSASQRIVKLRSLEYFNGGKIDAFKISNNMVLLFLYEYDAGWLLNLDVLKTVALQTKSEDGPIQYLEILNQYPFKVVYLDPMSCKMYQYTLTLDRVRFLLKVDKLKLNI